MFVPSTREREEIPASQIARGSPKLLIYCPEVPQWPTFCERYVKRSVQESRGGISKAWDLAA